MNFLNSRSYSKRTFYVIESKQFKVLNYNCPTVFVFEYLRCNMSRITFVSQTWNEWLDMDFILNCVLFRHNHLIWRQKIVLYLKNKQDWFWHLSNLLHGRVVVAQLEVTLGDVIAQKNHQKFLVIGIFNQKWTFFDLKLINYHFLDRKSSKRFNNSFINVLNWMDRLKHWITIFFGRSTKNDCSELG